jgi:hypothetical protein
LKGRHLDDIDDIRSNTMAALKVLPYWLHCTTLLKTWIWKQKEA